MDKLKATMLLAEIKGYLTAGNPVWDVDEIAEACGMAIEALRNEINCVKCVHYAERETNTGIKGVCKMDTAHSNTNQHVQHVGCVDLINRQDAIDAWDKLSKRGRTEFDQVLMTLPSAEPKMGEWIEKSTGGEMFSSCSVCGYVEWDAPRYFCPNCGARMLGEDGEEE